MVAPEDVAEEPMNMVKRTWKYFMCNDAPYLERDLQVMWQSCVTGEAVILDGEKVLSSEDAEDEEAKVVRTIVDHLAQGINQPKCNDPEYGDSAAANQPPNAMNRPNQEPQSLQRRHQSAFHPFQWGKIFRRWRRRYIDFLRLWTFYKPSTPRFIAHLSPTPEIFIVVGWFPGALHEPIEVCVEAEEKERFLHDLRRQIRAIRGWRSYLSFKTVQGFGLYKCHPRSEGHEVCDPSPAEKIALAQFFAAIDRSMFHSSPRYTPTDSRKWANWVHRSFNESQKYPFRSELSLQLIIKWSQTRIIFFSSIPLALSMVIGMYYMFTHNNVEGASAAWTIASYIVTTGAFIIGLLGALSQLKDG